MGLYNDQILPRLTHLSMRSRPIGDIRRRILASTHGDVLDVGFGSGLNLPHYPGAVSRVLAVEPSQVARHIAEPAIAAASCPIEFIGLDGQRIALGDGSVDCVVTTWTLCTIPDAGKALAEFARVLKPGGLFVFAEHGLSPDPGVARWQNRLNGLQIRFAGGCNLNRKIDELIQAAPFTITLLDRFYFEGLRTHSYFYVGAATRSG